MGHRGRSSRRIAQRQKLQGGARSKRSFVPEKKSHSMIKGRGGVRRVLRAKPKMSVSYKFTFKPAALIGKLCEEVSHCKPISEIQAMNPSLQSELEKVMEIFSDEEEEPKVSPIETVPNNTLDSNENKETVAEVSKIENSVENFDCSEAKEIPQLSEKTSSKEDEDSDKKLPELPIESFPIKNERKKEKPVWRNITKGKEKIVSRRRPVGPKVRNSKVRGLRQNGLVSIGQQRGHKYLNMLSKRNRLNMYKMSMDKSPTLQISTRSLSASANVNMNSSPPNAKSRRKRKEFQPKSKRTLSKTDSNKKIANNINFDSSLPGTSKGCNQSSSSSDMSSLPTILRNSVIEKNSDSEMDEEEDVECAKRRSETASKEVVDVIDGIAFVTFESEHDMVRFTRFATEESPSKSDGNDRRLILESLGAIIPRKTKDIKKIKGWQRKKFSVSLNPMIEPMNHDGPLEVHDDDAGNIVFEHNYIRRLSSDLESDKLLKSGDSNGDQKIDSSEVLSKPIPESAEEQSKSTSDSTEEKDQSTPVSLAEPSKSTPCSSKEQTKSTPDTSKTRDWKQSAMSAFVSYHPESQAKGVQSPSENAPKNKLPVKNPRENPNEEKCNSESQKLLSVNGAKKLGRRSKLLKSKRDMSVQVDLPETECRKISINAGDMIKYPSYDGLTMYNNNWEINHERAVFATTALVLNFPLNKKKKCNTIETKEKEESGYSLRKRVGAINRRKTLRSAKNGAPVRITRALSNLLSPANQSPSHSSSELAKSKLSSPVSNKVSNPDSKKSTINDQNKFHKIRPSPEINKVSVSHSSEDTQISRKSSLINSHDLNAVDTHTVTSGTTSVDHNEDTPKKLEILSPENVPGRKSSPPLMQTTPDNSDKAISHSNSENAVEENVKISVENEEAKDPKQTKADESKPNNDIKIKSKGSKIKPSGSEKELETVEWEISHKSNLPIKEMSPDQDHEDIRVFLRPKPRYQGNQSVSTASDASTFSASESSFGFTNNLSPQKSGDIEVIKSRSPKSPALARKKLIRELSKLSANFVSVDEKCVLQKKVCKEEFCKLGCVCDSINTEKRVVEHCGRIECMFSCICPSKSSVPRPQVIRSDTVSRLQEESSRGMAKIEKDFHNTVVEADGELVLPGRRQRERRIPKRFLDDESISPDSLFSAKKSKHCRNNGESTLNAQKNEQKVAVSDDKKKNDEVNMKQCKIPIENLPIPDLQVRCLNHFTVDCTCINKFPRNIAVKSTTPRNVAILSKLPRRIPFSLCRSNIDLDENLNNPLLKHSHQQEGEIDNRYVVKAPSKALYVHHIQGDVVSVKLQNITEEVRETSPNPSPKIQAINSNVETVLLTSCARTVGIDLWSAGHSSIWKNKSLYNIPLRPSIEDSCDLPEKTPKNDSENSSGANSIALEENPPMFKIVDVKSLPPGSFDPTLYTPEEGVDQPKHFSSYENFYSWIYSSHTMCQDLRSICSNSLAPLPVNSVKLMKWKDLNTLIKSHSAHMWMRQRLGSKPRIYVTEKDIQPDSACVNFLDLERKESELTDQVAVILKSAKEDLSSEHSCCILICRGCYWAVAGNINLEKHSANTKLQKDDSRSRTIPRILMKKSTTAQTTDVTNKSSHGAQSRLKETESSLDQLTLTKINAESTSSPRISAELTSAKAFCSSNQSENLDPDQILSDIETSLPDILEGLVPCNNSVKAQDNLKHLNKEGCANSPKLGGNSFPSGSPTSRSNIELTAGSTSQKISLLKPKPDGNNLSFVKSVEVSITHLTSQDNKESSKVSSSIHTPTTPNHQVDGLGIPEDETFSRIIGMSETSSLSSVKTLMNSSIEMLPPAALMEGDIDVCVSENEISNNEITSEKDKPNSNALSPNSKVKITKDVVNKSKFIPLNKGYTVIGGKGKIMEAINAERKELPLEALSQALSDTSKVKLGSDPPPVLIIDLKKLRKGPNAKNEPVKIPVRVTNLKTLAQGLTEPRNVIDNISARIGSESNIVTKNNASKLVQESASESKIFTPEKDVMSGRSGILKSLKALTPRKSPIQPSPKNKKPSSPITGYELRRTNELSAAKISASQNEEMTVTSRNVTVNQGSSTNEEENHQKIIMPSTEDKSVSEKSKSLGTDGNASETSTDETSVEKSRPSTQKIELPVSPSVTDDANAGLLSPSGSSELNYDKQKDLENDLIWYRLYLNHKFDRLVFTATSFSASEKRIISAVEMARSSNRTVRISFNKNANSYLEFRKGIYAVPTIEEKYVRIGPYAKDEPTGVLLLKKDGQSYKPVSNLLVKERSDTTFSNATASLNAESPCLGKEADRPNLSSTNQEINKKDSLSSVGTKSELGRFEKFSLKDKSNLDKINLGSNNIPSERVPCNDCNSAKVNNLCKEKVTETNDIPMQNLNLERTDCVSPKEQKEGCEQHNSTSGIEAQSSKDDSGASQDGTFSMVNDEGGKDVGNDAKTVNGNSESISSKAKLCASKDTCNSIQRKSSPVDDQQDGIIAGTPGSCHINGAQQKKGNKVSEAEPNDKKEKNGNVKNKRVMRGKFLSQKSREASASEDSADLSIKIQCVEGNFSAYGDLPSCNAEEENAMMFENRCNELMAVLHKSNDSHPKEEMDVPLEDENYRYLSSEIIEQLRRKKLIGSLSIEPIFADKPPLSPINKNKECDKEGNKRKAVEQGKCPVAKKSTTGRVSGPLIPVKGYMFPDIPNLSPIPVKKGLMYTIEDPERPGRNIEVPDVSTMNEVIDEALRKCVNFFPIDFRISWTFVRAEKSSVPGMIELKDITKDMFITSKGVLCYADYKTMEDVKKLGLDKDEKFRYFELKRRRETELAKVEVASLFVPKCNAATLNLAKVLRKTMAEIRSLKESEENLSQINLIETRKKLQLEEKFNALIRAEGTLTLYTPPVHTPAPPTPPPPQPLPPPPPLLAIRRPTRGRPPKRRYMRGRWRGYRGDRATAPNGLQMQGLITPSGIPIKPGNPVGRPRRGRPISRRVVTRGSLSMPASAEVPVTPALEPSLTSAEDVTSVVENAMVKAKERTPPKRKLKGVVPPITSASPDTVRNLIATITAPKVINKEVPDESDKTSVLEEKINLAEAAPLESSSDDLKKQEEEKANGQINALLWKESFSKVKVNTENPLPPSKDKLVDPKERMKKIIAESQEKLLQKLSCIPNSSKNLTSWSEPT